MRIDVSFLSPDWRRPRAKPKAKSLPALTITTEGRFMFNSAAKEMLELRPTLHVMLGPGNDDERYWYLRMSADEGFLLLTQKPGPYAKYLFKSTGLRKTLLDTLPHAPRNEPIRLVLEEMPVTGPDDEAIWPLLTAPYFQPQTENAPEAAPPAEATRHGLYRVVKTVLFGGEL